MSLLHGIPPITRSSALAYLISKKIQEENNLIVYVAPDTKTAIFFEEQLRFFSISMNSFPAYDVLPFSGLSPHADISCERLTTLFKLSQNQLPQILITTLSALRRRIPKPGFFQAYTLQKGNLVERSELLKMLGEWGYQNSPLVSDRGNFAIRGFLIDVFSPAHENPLRIEWFGDEIESIREFDLLSQKTIRTFSENEQATILPVREVILTPETVQRFSSQARALAESRDLTRSFWSEPVEKIKEGIHFPGIENLLPLFYESGTLWDWLPPSTLFLLEEMNLETLVDDLNHDFEHFTKDKKLISPEELLLSPSEIQNHLQNSNVLTVIPFLETIETAQPSFTTHENIRREIDQSRKSIEPLAPLVKHLREWTDTDAVFIASSTKTHADRLLDLLSPHFQNLIFSEKSFLETEKKVGAITLLTQTPHRGFRDLQNHFTLLTEEEIFGQKTKRKDGKQKDGLSSFAELKPGSPLVHKDHGIGLYQGLLQMDVNGVKNDFLVIEYKDGDKLYLPVYRMNLVQRYKGAEDQLPTLDKMGGASWAKIRTKAEKVIKELAGELLNLYAARTAGKGFAFSPPNEMFEAFEASFPYEETIDQEKAISDVLGDMMNEKPMDRLVLGDVGYGKTEVAMRAAFKAVLDGKQVAILVPTTLLAFQHFERLQERFRDYPVKVAMMSRFRSPAENKKTLLDLAQGKIDIVVGTHRLLQSDVSFKDLGLLVIDEEHRFGVEHKEKVKRLKKSVDVLALSATPIPRTFYMSIVGIRNISVIETPPVDRLAIRTFVTPFDPDKIHDAISRELKRGGQVFFVHNEVQTIGRMKAQLQEIIPEAKIEIAHGQMDADGLEEVMVRFFHQDFNVLLCTTIIESGIDVPTANTLIINNADHFGLSQIYQLRGRVGRGNHRAYAYLLVPPGKPLTKESQLRLDVLQRFSDLGSGHKIATYDLEIRGAGNLLGTKQSGQMEAIGYELYTDILNKAIRELKGEHILDEIDPELHFPIPSYLPTDYIDDPALRLEFYRRLASMNSEDETEIIEHELKDRFGDLPPEVENLLQLSLIKVHAKKLRLKQIRFDGKYFSYAFDPSTPLNPDFLTERVTRSPRLYKLTPDMRFVVMKPIASPTLALEEAKKFLREMGVTL
ncbi:MAG: transcription-repair coupling factor [Deltaproteobacteria bacterium]|nr:MAG: transcription-repair coupling factor [Deltaproteobacteria bacterium]